MQSATLFILFIQFADEMRKQEQKWKRRFKDVEAKHHKELEQVVSCIRMSIGCH